MGATGSGRDRSGALLVGAGIMASRLAGLVRERVFAHYLGNSAAAGAFKTALRIPNFLQNLFGEGVLSASFIPVYSRLLAEGKVDEARRLAGVVASLLFLLASSLVALGLTLARPLTELVAPGFQGEVRELTIRLVQVMFIGSGLLVLSAWSLGVLNSHRRFFLSYVAPVFWNVAQISALLFFGTELAGAEGPRWIVDRTLTETLAWATVVGAGLQLLVQLPGAIGLLGVIRPSLALDDAGRKVVSTFLPVLVGRGVVQISAYVDQLLASYLGPAVVSAIGSAQTLSLLPVSLFGMAVSAAELPEMARDAVRAPGERERSLRVRTEDGARRIAFFVIPSAMAFTVLGDCVVGALYQTGRFAHSDTLMVWLILGGSAVGLVAATVGRLCASCFYVLADTRTPLRFAVLRVALTCILGWATAMPLRARLGYSEPWGAAGLTASAGLAAWIEFLLLRRALAKRLGPLSLVGRETWIAWAAAFMAGGIAWAGRHLAVPLIFGIQTTVDAARWARVGQILRTPVVGGLFWLGAFGMLYLGLAGALGHSQARSLARRLRPFRRFAHWFAQ